MGKKVKYSVYVKVPPYNEFHVCTKTYDNSEAPFFDGRAAGYHFYQQHEGTNGILSKTECFQEFVQLYPEEINNPWKWLEYYNKKMDNSIIISVFPEEVVEDET